MTEQYLGHDLEQFRDGNKADHGRGPVCGLGERALRRDEVVVDLEWQ